MIIKELPKNVEFMSLGTNCLMLYGGLLSKSGPLDNILSKSTTALESILNRTYLKKFLKSKIEIINCQKIIHGLRKTHYFFKDLDMTIMHNEYNSRYQINHIKRLKTLYKALESNNTIFYLSIPSDYHVENFKQLLIKYNLIDRTIVITNIKYKDDFKYVIPITMDRCSDSESFNINLKEVKDHLNTINCTN
jgi:hypothetical protein